MNLKNTIITVSVVGILVSCLGLPSAARVSQQRYDGSSIWEVQSFSDPVIRLHVLANSNLPEDQQLKYRVAEQVRQIFAERYALAEEKDYLAFLEDSLPGLQHQLQCWINDSEQERVAITVKFVKEQFPLRVYAQKVYPAGDYRALKVIIGDGLGENWWCLLFPSLCLPLVEAEEPLAEEQSTISTGRREEAGCAGEQQEPRWRIRILEWFRNLFLNN